MIYYLVIFVIIILFFYFNTVEKFDTKNDINQCIQLHNSFPWFNNINNGFHHVEYLDNGEWKIFTDWKKHCETVSHNPNDLITSHFNEYINPKTKHYTVRYVFNNGAISEPTPFINRLEQLWFSQIYKKN